MRLERIDKWIDFGIAVVVWGVVRFTMLRAVPLFADVFKHFGGRLPACTRLVVRVSDSLVSTRIPFAAVALAGLVLFQVWRIVSVPPPLPGNQPVPWDSRIVQAIILLGVLVFLFVVVSIYMPVLASGETVSS